MLEDLNFKKNLNKICLIILIIIALGIVYYYALRIDSQRAPDELFRVKIPYFLYLHNYLPFGNETEIIEPNWGTSYAFVPYLPSIIAYAFMKIASFFSGNLHVAMRLVSGLSLCGTIFVANKIGKEIFERDSTALLFATLCGFLPQFIFLGSYFNNDTFSVLMTSIIIFCWIRGIKTNWKYRYCVLLGISLGGLTLTYYFAYGFILISIPLFIISYYNLNKGDWTGLVKKGLVIFLTSFIIAGWFFIRNYILHNGDFLGIKTDTHYSELYALNNEFKPSQRLTPANLNESFIQAFLMKKSYFNWVNSSIMSFIGYFGMMKVPMAKVFYIIYLGIFGIGLILAIIYKWKEIIQFRVKKIFNDPKYLFYISLICTIIISIGCSMYHSYYIDYQPQGRYFITILLPLMLFVSFGYEYLMNKINKIIKCKNYIEINYFIIIFYVILIFIVINRYFLHLWI